MLMKRSYLKNVLIAIDQLANAVLGGEPDETISSRAYRRRIEGSKKWALVEKTVNTLFFFDKVTLTTGETIRHCQLSMLSELFQAKAGYRVYKMEAHAHVLSQLEKNAYFPL